VFSFYLGNSDSDEGELYIGGIDTTRFTGQLAWIPLISTSFWQVLADSVSIGKTTVATKIKAIVDSGTSILTAPSAIVQAIAKEVGAIRIFGGRYILACPMMKILPDIRFTLNGIVYVLTPNDYIIRAGQEQLCLLGFMELDIPSPVGPAIILGDIFMRKYFTVFDAENGRIGLSLAKHTQTKDSCIA
jgi:Eukaryotic aspartyl protease